MKMTFFFALLTLLTALYSDEHPSAGWSVSKQAAPLSYSVEFFIKQEENTLSRVVRSGLFTPRYYYDVYNSNDNFVMRGITRAFSLGLLFNWGIEMDLYDASEQHVGMICGEFWSSSRAKFAFYDLNGRIIAHAYLNDESCNFMLVSNENEKKPLAEFKGKVYGDASMWEMKPKSAPIHVEESALYIFAAFISDFQRSFIRPPKVIHHHHYNERE